MSTAIGIILPCLGRAEFAAKAGSDTLVAWETVVTLARNALGPDIDVTSRGYGRITLADAARLAQPEDPHLVI